MFYFTVTAYMQASGKYGNDIAKVAEQQANIAFVELICEIITLAVVIALKLPS